MKFFKILIIIIFLLMPAFAFADEEVKFTPQVGIPRSDFKTGSEYAMTGDTQPIGEYISSIYSYAVAIVGILAACTLILGGLLWLTAGGSAERVTSAKSWIGSSLTGLLLVTCSYLLLSMVNPNLVKFQISGIEKPKAVIVSPDDHGLKDGGKACCLTDPECGEGYVCNMKITTGPCFPSKGACVATSGLAENMPCDPSKTNQCAPPLQCIGTWPNGRCLNTNPAVGKDCYDGNCAAGLYCYGQVPGSKPGICYDGILNDFCALSTQCNSQKCIDVTCYNTCLATKTPNVCYNDCKQENFFTSCWDNFYKCKCL